LTYAYNKAPPIFSLSASCGIKIEATTSRGTKTDSELFCGEKSCC